MRSGVMSFRIVTTTILLFPVLLGGCPVVEPTALTATATDTPTPDQVRDSLQALPPTASAGVDQTVTSGQLVTLNGTGSSDPQRARLFYAWQQVNGDSDVEFESSAFASLVQFTAPEVTAPTPLQFSLTVGNGYYAVVDDVTITINPR